MLHWFFGVCVCAFTSFICVVLCTIARKGHIVSMYRSGKRLNPCLVIWFAKSVVDLVGFCKSVPIHVSMYVPKMQL